MTTPEQDIADIAQKLAKLGWQAIECDICGSSARAFPQSPSVQQAGTACAPSASRASMIGSPHPLKSRRLRVGRTTMAEWKLVPVEPTGLMTYRGQQLRPDTTNSIGAIYREMLAAAPQAPSGQQAEPTDAQLIALNAGERFFSESPTKYPEAGHGTQYHAGAPGVVGFARAAIALAGQQSERPAPAGQPRPFAEVVQHNQGRYFTCLAAPGVDQPEIGAKVYLAAPAGQAGPNELLARAAKLANAGWTDVGVSVNSLQTVLREVLAALAASQAERPAVKEKP